jgi:hypothetical protein
VVRYQEKGNEGSNMHGGRQMVYRDAYPGDKLTQGVGVTTNLGTNSKRVSHYSTTNTTKGVPGMMANPDMNLEWVNYHPTTNTARKVPAPRWCPTGLTKTQ